MRNFRAGASLVVLSVIALLILRYVPGSLLSNIAYANATAGYISLGIFFYILARFLRLPTLHYFKLPVINWKSVTALLFAGVFVYLELNRDDIIGKTGYEAFAGCLYLLSIGFGEEMVSRVFTFGVLKKYGTKIAFFGSSALFGLMHLNLYVGKYWDPWSAYWHVAQTFAYGTFICALMILTRSVGVVILFHALSDWSVVFVADSAPGRIPPDISISFWSGITVPLDSVVISLGLAMFLMWINRGIHLPRWMHRLFHKWKLVQ